MSRSRVDEKVLKYIGEIIENSGQKGEDKIKMALLSNKFYHDNKAELDLIKAPARTRMKLMANFLLFMVKFETVCARAFKPLSGSQSVGREIMKLHSDKQRSDLLSDLTISTNNTFLNS